MSLNTFFELHMKSRKVGGILAKTAPKKGKTITTETLHLVTNDDMKMAISVGRWLKCKTMLV